jgi:hypothetical protein
MSVMVAWPEIEHRVRTALTSAGIGVRAVHQHIASRPYAFNHLRIDMRIRDRFHAVKAIANALGPDYIARYHKHANSHPQDAVFVFQADRDWGEEAFQRCNVKRGRSKTQSGRAGGSVGRGTAEASGGSLLDRIEPLSREHQEEVKRLIVLRAKC